MSKILDKIVLRDTKTGISTEYTIQDTQLKERVENLIANKNNTNGNSELIDIRTGFDGNKYDTAGDAVRSQVSNLQEQVNDINNNGLIFNDDYISLKIDTWLKDHPEATTTVLDNSITKEKIEEDFLYDLRKARFYNSVDDMKSDSELKAGQVCKTLGYYSVNDGGGAYYTIREKADGDVDDGGSLHELANGLIAELIIHSYFDTTTVEYFFNPQSNEYTGNAIQGECSVIKAFGKTIVIDVGGTNMAEHVVSYLKSIGVYKIDYLIITHWHGDHEGNLQNTSTLSFIDWSDCICYLPLKSEDCTEYYTDADKTTSILNTLSSFGVKEIKYPVEGDMLNISKNFNLTFLNCGKEAYNEIFQYEADLNNVHYLNNYSIVVKVEHNRVVSIFPGDIQVASIKRLYDRDFYSDVDLYKMHHHGVIMPDDYAYVSSYTDLRDYLKIYSSINPKKLVVMNVATSPILEYNYGTGISNINLWDKTTKIYTPCKRICKFISNGFNIKSANNNEIYVRKFSELSLDCFSLRPIPKDVDLNDYVQGEFTIESSVHLETLKHSPLDDYPEFNPGNTSNCRLIAYRNTAGSWNYDGQNNSYYGGQLLLMGNYAQMFFRTLQNHNDGKGFVWSRWRKLTSDLDTVGLYNTIVAPWVSKNQIVENDNKFLRYGLIIGEGNIWKDTQKNGRKFGQIIGGLNNISDCGALTLGVYNKNFSNQGLSIGFDNFSVGESVLTCLGGYNYLDKPKLGCTSVGVGGINKTNKDVFIVGGSAIINNSVSLPENPTNEDYKTYYHDRWSRTNAFRVQSDGNCYAGSAFNSTGADYAEYFEWSDENPDNEDRIGHFITFDNGKNIRIATSADEYILGITSSTPAVVGNRDNDEWSKKYLRDKFDRIKYETKFIDAIINNEGDVLQEAHYEQVPMINPEYNYTRNYISRENRKEWSLVGMLGMIAVYDDGTCVINGYCKPNDNGVATKSDTGYRVIERVSDNVVKVLFR